MLPGTWYDVPTPPPATGSVKPVALLAGAAAFVAVAAGDEAEDGDAEVEGDEDEREGAVRASAVPVVARRSRLP